MKKEKFIALANAIGASEMAEKVLPMLEKQMECIVDYVKAVYMMDIQIQIMNARTMDKDEAIEKFHDLDVKRRRYHDAAIAALSVCNKMSERFGAAPIYDGDMDDRYEVADFCGDFVKEVFDSATVPSYSPKTILEKLLEK